MRRAIVATAVLALVLVVASSAFAQGISYTSGFQVQNLDSSNPASIEIKFYNQDGTVAATVPDTIPAGANKTYYPLTNVPEGFNGSAVISSDREIAAITNLLGDYPQYGGSTTGFSAGSTDVGLPLIMRGNNGFSTWFNVQNTGSSDANVTVTYRPGSAGSADTDTAVIKPGAAATFDQASNTSLGSKFIGSATISSDQPVVATVNQVGSGGIKALLMYDGFTGGSTSVLAPLVMANNNGFWTSLNIQNVGSSNTTVTVDYGPNTAGSFNPSNETCSLAAGGSCNLLQNGGQWTQKYIGSATISASQPLVVVVNQLRIGSVSFGTAYEGYDPTKLTSKASAPLIMSNNSGFYTSLNIQSDGTPTTVTVDYSPNTAGSWQPANETCQLTATRTSCNILQAGGQWGSNKYIGSATVTASGGAKIAVIINELNLSAAGDQFLTYNAINY